MKKLIIIILLLAFFALAFTQIIPKANPKSNIEMVFEVQEMHPIAGMGSVIEYTLYKNGTWTKKKIK